MALAQASFGHLDTIELEGMRSAYALSATGEASDMPVTFLMRVADDATVARVEAAGATIEQQEGCILVLTAPLSMVKAVAATEGVVTVSLPKDLTPHASLPLINPMGNDLSRSAIGLDLIQAGAEPFSRAYTGEGVVLGIIDMGVDVHHKAFLNSDGTHRVKRIWKHVVSGKSTMTLTSDTEEKIAKFKTDTNGSTHGTHTMGIAAGSFNEADGPDFRGAAPEAEIVVSCGSATTPLLLKGARAIVDYARSQGKPCVINISLGNNSGPHDGTDEFSAGLDEIIEGDDVTVFVSAGNEGDSQAFLYKEFSEGDTTLRTFLAPSAYTSLVFPVLAFYPQAIGSLELWSDDDTPFTVHYDVVKIIGGKAVVQSTFTLPEKGSGYLSNAASVGVNPDVLETGNEDFNAAWQFSYAGGASGIYAGNNRFRTELTFQLQNKSMEDFEKSFIALRIEGKPGHKVYAYGSSMSGIFPFALLGGGFEGYTTSNSEGSINTVAGSKHTITVGAFHTHNFTPVTTWGRNVVGTTASYSSWGTTPDGRVHPMICAPGTNIVSSMSADYVASSDFSEEYQPIYYTYTDGAGKKHYFTPMTGTSMASPFMCGVAATWLSADPTLTSAELLEIAQQTSDAPVQARVNDGASGHLNAYAGLCKVLGLTGISNIAVRDLPYTISRTGNVFTVKAPVSGVLSAKVYSLQGNAVISASAQADDLTIDCSAIDRGIYVMAIEADGTVATEKIHVK